LEFIPASLSPATQVDVAVLGAELGFLLHQIQDTRWYQRCIDTCVAEPFRGGGLADAGNDWEWLNNHASVADPAVHEGFPGHDWHDTYMTRHAREISNIRWFTPGAVEDSSSMWQDSMAAEGWALYSEELMAEPAAGHPHGFYTSGEHLYELQGQPLRAVRVRVDVGIHTGRMGCDAAVDYFAAHVSLAPGVRQGPAFNPRGFHESFMRMGTIPVGYFRSLLLT
jgi:Bacterial protein of unknown function (DUF885)